MHNILVAFQDDGIYPSFLQSAHDHVTGDEMVAAMDAVGVDGAILVSAFSMYRYDASYAVQVRNAHPGRFALVKPIEIEDPTAIEGIAEANARCSWAKPAPGPITGHPRKLETAPVVLDVASSAPGESVRLTLLRAGERVEIELEIP